MTRDRRALKRLSLGWHDLWPLVLATGLVVCSVFPLLEWLTLADLTKRGVLAPATVTSTTIDASGRHAFDVIHYEFQPEGGGERIADVARFSRSPLGDLEPGEFARLYSKGELNVRHLPSTPSVHDLDAGLSRKLNRKRRTGFLLLGGGLIVGAFGLLRAYANRSPRRD